MPITKPFAIATEGPTVDGRNISREWLLQMASSYDPKVYTAVVNLEHYLSFQPDSTFSAYGKVVSLATREVEILGEKKLQLTGVVDAAQEAVDLQKAGKKAFASIEIKNNFINKGGAYLTGLALTDTPASIGTESMKFSAFSDGKKDSVFAFGAEFEIEFEKESPAPSTTAGDGLFAKIKALLGGEKKDTAARFADVDRAVEAIATSQKEVLDAAAAQSKVFADISADSKANADALAALSKQFAELKGALDKAPDGTKPRPAATGADGVVKTDC